MTDSATKSGDRPLPTEIKVTPRMLSAASEVLRGHYLGWAEGGYDVRDEVMAEVYRAMYAAQ